MPVNVRKFLLLFFIGFLCKMHSFAQAEWNFTQAAFLFGPAIQYELPSVVQIALICDRGVKLPKKTPFYFGGGVHLTNSYLFREYGIKAYANLVFFSFGVSPDYRVFPYFYFQQNHKAYRVEYPPHDPRFIPRTGIGFSGVSVARRKDFVFRSGFQFGYSYTQTELLVLERFSGEIMIGVGKNVRK